MHDVEKHSSLPCCNTGPYFLFVALDLCRAYLDLALDRRTPIRVSCAFQKIIGPYLGIQEILSSSPPPPLERPHKLFITRFTFTPRIARGTFIPSVAFARIERNSYLETDGIPFRLFHKFSRNTRGKRKQLHACRRICYWNNSRDISASVAPQKT